MAEDTRPTVYILSDSLGDTAEHVSRAALLQFPEGTFHVVRLPRITSRGQLEGVIRGAMCEGCVFFYTLAEPKLRVAMEDIAHDLPIGAVDILGPLVGALANASQSRPAWRVGVGRRPDRGYFERVEALDFAVQHDDGRNTTELDQAEIVLIGVSRTAKTPLAMYLAFKGYRVANVPLVPGVDPPKELLEIEPKRIFGLVTEPELLTEIRQKRAGDLGIHARDYSDLHAVSEELDDSRTLMRRLGIIVVPTGGRAIEETAEQILTYFESAVPGTGGRETRPEAVMPPMPPRRSRRTRRRPNRPGD